MRKNYTTDLIWTADLWCWKQLFGPTVPQINLLLYSNYLTLSHAQQVQSHWREALLNKTVKSFWLSPKALWKLKKLKKLPSFTEMSVDQIANHDCWLKFPTEPPTKLTKLNVDWKLCTCLAQPCLPHDETTHLATILLINVDWWFSNILTIIHLMLKNKNV